MLKCQEGISPTVESPVMHHRWQRLGFLHWPVAAGAVQRVLPGGLEVDTLDGTAWIGLVPFVLHVRVPGLPYLPWASGFPETNVRSYVVGPEGPGIWFHSLDAARLGAVLFAQQAFGLAYAWSSMAVDHDGETIRYVSRRRWPAPRGASSDVWLEIGDRLEPGRVDELDRFLTARWRLYCWRGGALHSALAEHQPWPLHEARPIRVADGLVRAAGIELPDRPPLARYAPGVDVRLSRFTRC
jgi:uncharacterized protein YqjF (DUF2071 family)